MASACPLLSDGITDDTLLHIARFLPAAKDLLSLGLTCTRFSITKTIAAPGSEQQEAAEGVGAVAAEMLCIMEEAARRWVARCSDQERGWVPRRGTESLLGLMHELELLRRVPLAFDPRSFLIWTMRLSDNGAVARKGGFVGYYTAASSRIMRAGRHYAQFTSLVHDRAVPRPPFFGVIRPGWDVERCFSSFSATILRWKRGHCFYGASQGSCYPGSPREGQRGLPAPARWLGQQGSMHGDRIGMLLDLDQGSMTLWKNDVKLGVMVAEGLHGPLCWAVALGVGGARIDPAPAPASPTEEELAAAKVWLAAR